MQGLCIAAIDRHNRFAMRGAQHFHANDVVPRCSTRAMARVSQMETARHVCHCIVIVHSVQMIMASTFSTVFLKPARTSSDGSRGLARCGKLLLCQS